MRCFIIPPDGTAVINVFFKTTIIFNFELVGKIIVHDLVNFGLKYASLNGY